MTVFRIKGSSGAVAGQAHELAERTRIGSGKDCDVRIDDPAAAPLHAEIRRQENTLLLEHLAARGETALNGNPVRTADLSSGDEIRIGHCRWVVQAPGLKPGRVLTEDAVRRRRPAWPWLLLFAAAAAAALAWQRGWIAL